MRLNIYDHPDMGGRFQLLLPADYLLQVFPLKFLFLSLDLAAQVYGFTCFCLQVAQCL